MTVKTSRWREFGKLKWKDQLTTSGLTDQLSQKEISRQHEPSAMIQWKIHSTNKCESDQASRPICSFTENSRMRGIC